jgi:hypothetical protein
MIAPWTRVAELRRLVDEVAVVDWNDRAWWALMAAAAAAETIADLRPRVVDATLIHDGTSLGDTMMAWAVLPPRNLAEAIADAIIDARAGARALDELDGQLIEQPLRVTVEQFRDHAELRPADPARVRFAVAGRWMDARVGDDPRGLLVLARELARLATSPRANGLHEHALPAAVAAVIGDSSAAVARHLHRHTWTAAGGPWLGLGRSGVLGVASTCHRVVDGYGHALIASRIAAARAADAGMWLELVRAAGELCGDAPVPPLPPLADEVPLGLAWCRLGAPLPRFAQLAHGLGHVLWDEVGDRGAPISPVLQVPVAPGPTDDPLRWRRRVLYTLLSVRFQHGHAEPVAAFAERAAATIAREREGRGLLSRLLGATAAVPLPMIAKRRGIVGTRADWLSGPIDVLAGWSSLSKFRLGPGDEEVAPALVAVSSPSRLLPAGDARSTTSVTVVQDAAGATITVAGSGRAGTAEGAREILDGFLARAVRPD